MAMSTMTTTQSSFDAAAERIRTGSDVAAETEELVRQLTDEEKLWLLDGDDDFWTGMAEMAVAYNARPVVMGRIDRLGIPGLRFSDGPRGVVMGNSTAFPVSMARGATWDVGLEEMVGAAIGAEMRAQGGNFFGGVCINLPRHPAWGRAQETYGEDPYLLGEFGAALVTGIKRHGMAVVKHFALNSMENARFTVDVTVDDAALHEVYLPHFKRVVEAGVDGVMTSYNAVNGEWAGQNERLLEGILRGQWGFDGVTLSDFIFGIRDAARSLKAGLDVEAPFRQQRGMHLAASVEAGVVGWPVVDRAVRRIIGTQLRHAASQLDPLPSRGVVFSPEHRELARRAAAESAVLLRNEPVAGVPVLPLDPTSLRRVAVLGRLADVPNTGDHGSSDVRSPAVVTPLAGLRAALSDAEVVTADSGDHEAVSRVAADADVAIVVVGYTAADEGEYLGQSIMSDPRLLDLFPPPPPEAPSFADMMEALSSTNVMGEADGGDRRSLELRAEDVDLIRSVAAANPRTVVAIATAGAVITEDWRDSVPALVIGWYNGSEGGHGLADALLGRTDIVGRLPYSVPRSESDLPFFERDATSITYDKWFGQRLLDRDGKRAAFPLGFGLSYAQLRISRAHIARSDSDGFAVDVEIANTSHRRGRHVVQLYASVDAADFPRRVLVGFAPVWVDPGQTERVTVTGSFTPVRRWTPDGFVSASLTATIEVSAHAGDPDAILIGIDLP